MKNHKLPSRLLSLVLCICMVLSLMPMMPLVAEAATVPNYISSIGISQDGSSGSTGINDCKSELAGHTIIDVDLNDEAGGDYVYMGYKTTTDPAQAITGIVFRVGKNPPNSISYGGATFYLVGGSTEANTAKLGGYIDLNARAGGYYIYTYVTRDPNYGAPLTNLTVNRSSSYSGWYAGTDTNGNVMDLNDDASNYYLYLHYQRFSGKASSTFYYLTSGGSRTSSTTSVSVKNHTQSVSTTPSVPSTVTYDGRTFTFRGWREDNTASSSTVSPSYSYMTSKTYRAVYSATVALSYNANGGSGAPSSQTATQYINAGSSSVSKTSHSFTISATKPTHDDSKCVFLGWSTGSSATSASHQPSQTITISSNTTLYAVWRGAHTANRTYVNNGANHTYTWPCCGKSVTEAHSYFDGFCVCGAMIPDAVATVSKNGKVVAAYTILNDAIQAVQDCTAADEAVITILKGIALGDNYQTISSGVFTIDLNGFEISNTNSDYGALYVYGATVTIRDSGEDGKITGKRAGIEVFEGELTVLDGTVSGGSSRDNYGVYAAGSSNVTISGGSFSGYYGVYATGSSNVTISGGTISGESAGVYADRSNVSISSGSISSDTCGVYACNKSTATISGGTVSSPDYGVCVYYSTVTVSDGIVSGDFRGVDAYSSTVTISGGSVSSDGSGVYAYNASTVTISGGTVSGDDFGVDAYVSSTVTISGGTVSGVSCGVYACNRSTATLSGGSISGDQYDIRNINSTIALTLGEDGVGARFPGGITVLDTTLNKILGEGAAYWQGDTMIIPADGATEITGGDVVIKSTCPHASKSNYTDLKDGASHTYFCSGCNNTFTESHSYDATTLLCVCGAAHSDAVASVSKNGQVVAAYTTLNDAIQAVADCTAADQAVVTILQDIALGDDLQSIFSGVFTIDLNGHEISSTIATWGALYINGSASNVTIQGTGENSKITGDYAGIEISYGANVTIAGGTISGDWYGVFADSSNVTISGGSISSNAYDISCYSSTLTLTVDEDGVGATFPGGIEVRVTTLNAVLGEGAAYWQGNTMITPANNATEISGGDVVIKAECKHPGDKTYTNNGNDHSYTYSCCNATVTESHSYSNGLCACGAVSPDAVASVSKNGIVTGAYTTLNDAIQAVADCTAADKAVVTILQDIALGDSYQKISSGVFTIDLNGHEISSTKSGWGALYINGSAPNVTIQGAGENSKITGNFAGIEMFDATLTVISGTISGSTYGVNASRSTVTISGGTISGYNGVDASNSTVTITDGTISGGYEGVYAYESTVTISGGTISGGDGVYASNSTVTITGGTISGDYSVYVTGGSTVTITGGTISGVYEGVHAYNNSTVTISGGSISGDYCDIYNSYSTVTLTLGEDGVGATFPGGISVDGTTLNAILGEGAAYWQGYKQINPADDDTEIPGGDVVIKAACKHSGDKTYTNNGDDHTYTCSVCDATVTEGHTYIDGVCVCGVADVNVAVASTTVGGITTYYGTLGSAIQAVKDCTAADKAVVTILKDIALGVNYQTISSGVFTIDLNGHEISSTHNQWGSLYLSGTDVNVTVQGAREGSKITGGSDGITVFDKATLTITGGTISGIDCGVYAVGSTVTINGGTISGDRGVYIGYSTLIISDGTISGRFGVDAIETDLIISDGTISGDLLSVYSEDSTVTISGGSFSTGDRHIYSDDSTITLTLGENGVGARFLGGITLRNATLNEILGEGAAYWQGDKQIIPADNANAIFNGDVVIKAYVAPVYSGWTEIDGNWYYYDPDTGKPVTGITRVPYPAQAINGVTYAPNMEDVKYANDKGTLFKDSISAFFVFDENGVFQSGLNGMTSDNRWAVNGCIVWHVGLVQVGEDYYYFIGDVDNGGNKMATGDIYANRNTTDFDMVPGGVYTFSEDGKLCKNEGIVDLRYYENYRLMLGNGLTKVGENYIYVNSKGELIVDAEYYVPGNDLGIASGIYTFDENGFMIQPVSTDKDGVYFENDAWYYYESGEKQYGLGLIGVSKYWYYPDGTRFGTTATIYVRSNGQLATGEYYVTNVDNYDFGGVASGTKMIFSEEGMQYASKNGIYEIDGSLYYFVNNQIQYNAGLIELGGGWIYVRSNGQLAVGSYWITNTNGNLDAGMYEFGADGYLVITDIEDGIINENGVLYYYEDGKKQYGLGLRQLEDGSYIYVRTNGQLATGSYWITNHNGLLPEGMYTFGEDGILVEN